RQTGIIMGNLGMAREKKKALRTIAPAVTLAAGLTGMSPAMAAQPLVLDTYRVTGSHLGQVDMEGIAPLAVLDREHIDRSGASTVAELFRDTVFITAGVVDEQFTQGFAPGAAGIDLRGLGVNRTLVLLDGRRLPVYPYGQEGYQSFVDINSIPLAAIERIEVLKDGASAIYGADAIAGVVNIITRKGEEGVSGMVQLGAADEGDGEEGHASLVAGKNWGKTRATLSIDLFKRDKIMARDRDLSDSANGPVDDRSVLGRPGTWIGVGPGPLPPGLPTADPSCPPGSITSDGPATFCSYDFAPWVTLVPETKRVGLLGNIEHELNEDLRVFGRAYYDYTYTERDLAPTNNAPNLLFVGEANPTNPIGQDMVVLYRLEELGPRRDEFETYSVNLLGGISGVTGDWDWETAAGYGRVKADTRGVNGYAREADVQAEVTAGTLNLFGPSPGFNADSVSYRTKRNGKSELYFADVKASAEVLEMAHGMAQLALGAEVRHEDFEDKFDNATANGEVLGIGGTSADGDRDTRAVYAEVMAPLTDDLEIQLAGRFDDYSDFGSTFNPKLGVRWQPRADLLLRASAGTGFKAPALHELYSGDIEGFASLVDGGTLVSDVPVTSTGNKNLDAEKSHSFNLGFVWDVTPRWNVGVDGWYLKNKDAVVNDPQYILDNEAEFPDLVERDGDGNLVGIISPFQNVEEQRLWGVDLNTELRSRPGPNGVFTAGVVASYLGSFEREAASGDDEELAGSDGRPRWRARGTLDWEKGPYEAGLALNYIGDYTRESADDHVKDWTTVDARFKWQPPSLKGGALSLGINNLFDKEPPKDPYYEGWPFFNRALHDPRGRFLFTRYEHRF
ncbi:MAG: TonB-dependent receptor, partial [Sedimenticolaceae bacterium]